MNAAQQKAMQYDRAKPPINSSPIRHKNIQNIEYLDEHRSQKLRLAAEQRRLEDERQRLTELERYYNLKPTKKEHTDKQNVSTVYRRKLTATYIINPVNLPAKRNIETAKTFESTKKRLVFSELAEGNKSKHISFLFIQTKRVYATVLSILLVFAMLSCILIKQAQISNQTYTNSQMEKEINSLSTELSKLNMDRALKEDLTSVQYVAGSKGMVRPDDTQVVFVPINPIPTDKLEEQTNKNELKNDKLNGINSEELSTENNNISSYSNEFSSLLNKVEKTFSGWLS